MRQVKKFFRSHSDWTVVAAIVILLLVAFLGVRAYLDGEKVSQHDSTNMSRNYAQNEYSKSIYATKAPDPQYPPPATEQRTFYRSYDVGDLSYSLEWSNRNIERNPNIGPHIFTLEVYNSRNRQVTLDSSETKGLTVGCIATDNPYKAVIIEAKPLTLSPYERKRIELPVDVACMYLGTADGKYFWRIY
jgi:hypothetical protein